MLRSRVRSAQDALAFITDCNLATVVHMATLKSRPVGEYRRQISIAQLGIDWMETFGVEFEENSRALEATRYGGVAQWAKIFES